MTAGLALPDRAALDRELVRRHGMRAFVPRAWPQVDPAPFIGGRHVDAICEHLDAVRRREIRDLVINLPPGLGKSNLVSVLWPACVWADDPAHKFITTSYDSRVAHRDARKHRTLVEGDWYRARWPGVVIPRDASASSSVSHFYTAAGGMRFATTVRGSVTGQHANTHLYDDPLDPQGAAAASGVELDAVIEWFTQTMSTRFVDAGRGARVLVMQRLHERDLAAEMIRAGATVLCLPMEAERNHPHRYAKDDRAEGELLCPARFDAAAVARLKRELGPRAYAAQEQQRPVPAGGLVFKAEYFTRRWTELPPGGTFTMSVDCTFKDLKSSSWVVIQVWYQLGPNHYLVDQRRGHWGFVATLAQIVAMSAEWPRAIRKLIEDKANGTAVIEVAKRDLPGIEAVQPEGGKEARANANEPLWAAGNVILPHATHAVYPDGRRGAPWVDAEFVPEHLAFPMGTHDDQVDAASQYLNRFGRNPLELLKRAMANLAKG